RPYDTPATAASQAGPVGRSRRRYAVIAPAARAIAVVATTYSARSIRSRGKSRTIHDRLAPTYAMKSPMKGTPNPLDQLKIKPPAAAWKVMTVAIGVATRCDG